MITFFRRLFSTKLGVVLAMLFVALIGAAFALADVNAPGSTFLSSGTTIASVDGTDVSDEEIAQIMARALQNAREEQPGIDMATLIENGGLDQAIEQFVQSEAMAAFGSDHGIVISKRLIDAAIAQIPAFQGLTGNFDEASFRQVLVQQGLTEAEVRTDLTRQTLVGLMLGPITAGAQVPAAVARPYTSLLLEERSGQVAAIPSSAMPQGAAPTAEQLQSFYQDNVSRYTLPERRSLRYATFSREQIDVPAPTEEQIRAYYEANSETYGGSETRTFQQIILADQADARAFYTAVNDGADFGAEAVERGFSLPSTQVSGATQESFQQTTSASIAAAAFAADEGTLLEPVRSSLGWHVIRVADIVNRTATPLGSVRPEIVQTLSEQAHNAALGELYIEIESAIDDGASFEEVVEDKGLTIVSTPLVSATGVSRQQPNFRPTADLMPILPLAFTLGADEDPVLAPVVVDQRYALIDVTEIARSAPQPLASIREQVSQDFMLDRSARRARTIATEIAEKVNGGMTLSAALAEAGVTLPAPQPARATRRAISQAQNVPEPIRLLFRMAANTAKLVRLPSNQGWFVVVLESIASDPDEITPELIEATRSQFASVTANEYAEQFINAVLADYPVTRNEDAITALRERLTSGRSN